MLGNRLKEFRQNRNLKQGQLADILEINQGSLSRFEGEKHSPPVAEMLAGLCLRTNITPDELYYIVSGKHYDHAQQLSSRQSSDELVKELKEEKRLLTEQVTNLTKAHLEMVSKYDLVPKKGKEKEIDVGGAKKKKKHPAHL